MPAKAKVARSVVARNRGRRNLFGSRMTYSPTANKKAFEAGKRAGDTWAFDGWYKKSSYKEKGLDRSGLSREFERGVNAGIDEASAKRRKVEDTRETRQHAKDADDKSQGSYKGYALFKRDDGVFYSSLDRDTWRDSMKELKQDINDFERGRRNPKHKARKARGASPEKGLYRVAGKLALLGAGGVPAVLLANPGRRAGVGDETGVTKALFDSVQEAKAWARDQVQAGENALEVVWKDSKGKYQSQWFGRRSKKNPGTDAATEAYREFHGRDPEERIVFTSTHRFPAHTAAIGDLVELTIKTPKERGLKDRYVNLSNFGEAWLTRHPRMKQLYVEGGDQSVDLGAFGLDSKDPHETEYLGELVRCVYYTRKDHLGKDGGEANYHHRFGKNELTLDKTELIKVGYHVPDEQLLFVGGGYEIPAEGIDG